MLEATCGECGEIFIPDSDADTEHVARADGVPCGGAGTIAGEWH